MTVHNKDKLRTALRSIFSRRIYRFGAGIFNTAQVIRSQGLSISRTLHRPIADGETRRTVSLKGFEHPIVFRPGTEDVHTLLQNLIREEYGRLPETLDPKVIIDAGSYIGDAAIYFLNRFKNSRVIALEPDPENFPLAEENLRPYSDRASLLNKGLWSHETSLNVGGSFTGSSLIEAPADLPEIVCTSVADLIATYNLEWIDILKMDIEGAEKHVILENSESWLPKVGLIILEFHDDEIKSSCTQRLNEVGFEGFRYRSFHYFVNQTDSGNSTSPRPSGS